MVTDRYISENTEQAPERREAAKKRLETNQATYEKNEEEKNALLERLGIKKSFQKEKSDQDRIIESDKKNYRRFKFHSSRERSGREKYCAA